MNRKDGKIVQFESVEEREAFNTANLGDQAERFLRTNVGEALHARANETIEACRTAAMELDPNDDDFENRYRAIQTEHWRASTFISWVGQMIEDGREAEARLNNEETLL